MTKQIAGKPLQRKHGVSQSIGQSLCAKCGKVVRPGAGIVLHYGTGGRVHKYPQDCKEKN